MNLLRILFITFLFSSFVFHSNAQNKAKNLPQNKNLTTPEITFVKTVYDFGQIRLGDKIKTSYFFKNTGTKDLLLLQVQTSCGCTATEWSSEVIKPNEVGEIKVVFDTEQIENKIGKQNKVILVISNAKSKEVKLHLIGTVVK